MNVYIFTHDGIWPVGACSVVTAPDLDSARKQLAEMLNATPGLLDASNTAVLAWMTGAADKVILDGDY